MVKTDGAIIVNIPMPFKITPLFYKHCWESLLKKLNC